MMGQNIDISIIVGALLDDVAERILHKNTVQTVDALGNRTGRTVDLMALAFRFPNGDVIEVGSNRRSAARGDAVYIWDYDFGGIERLIGSASWSLGDRPEWVHVPDAYSSNHVLIGRTIGTQPDFDETEPPQASTSELALTVDEVRKQMAESLGYTGSIDVFVHKYFGG